MAIAAGSVFGPYSVVEKIGAGGMGDVYRALDTRLEREVALKLISEGFLASEMGSGSPSPVLAGSNATPHSRAHLSHERFLREARAAATLNHPNICAIHDVGEQDGCPYLVMELLQGETLKLYLSHHSLTVAEVLTLGQQAASALAAAHARGIVHRDIKPANLFVVESGRDRKQLKVLDFGLAKKQGHEASADSRYFSMGNVTGDATVGATAPGMDLTVPGSTVGTAAYMSPEQARGEPLDARTDLFSLGSVLFEMATAQPPFGGRSTAEVFAALLMKDPPPVSSLNPAMPKALDPVIAKLLAKDRDDRYASAEELLADLEAIPISSSSSSVRPAAAAASSVATVPVPSHAPESKSSRIPMLIGAVLLLAIVAALVLLLNHPGKLGTKPGTTTLVLKEDATKPASMKDAIIVADFVNKTGDAVFDSTLNQALRVQLGQSPVLDIVSQQHLRQSLQYLGRKQDEVVTPQIAREIGEREGVKAILTGTIAPVGNAFLLTLDAQNTATGDDIASEEATAPDKDHVLDALNKTATGMRAKLGESLSSIQRLNAPFGQATTPSLEAFRAYALGDEAHQKGDDIPEAEDHYKRALELDPKLAMAWARLGVIYLNSGQVSKANEFFTHAYQLSGNVSEREKLYISGHYYSTVVGDLNKSIETLQVATQEYPLQMDNFVNLGVYYLTDGEVEKSDESNRKALALQPDDAIALENGIGGSTALGRLDDARHFIEQSQRLKLNGTALYVSELQYYAVIGDWNSLQRIMTETAGRPDQFSVTSTLAGFEMEGGQFLQAHADSLRAADQAATVNEKDAQAAGILYASASGWPIGQCQDSEDAAKDALKLDKGKATESLAASMLSVCGEEKAASKALSALEKKYPQDTIIQEVVVPQGRAFLALKTGDGRHTIELLERVRAHDDASIAPYLRGLAYLQMKDAQSAIAAFQEASRLKGVAYYTGSPHALSELGLGRAYVLAGDKVNAKKAYGAFFAEWNNADAGLPVMAEAKKEYAQL